MFVSDAGANRQQRTDITQAKTIGGGWITPVV